MKMNIFKGSMALFLGSMMLFAACKKDDDTPEATNTTKIIGTWKKTYDALDANNNSIVDASEKISLDSGDYEYLTFASNSVFTDSLRQSGFSGTFSGTWSISGDYVTVTTLGFTDALKLTQLDNGNLVVQDTSAHPAVWTGYVK